MPFDSSPEVKLSDAAERILAAADIVETRHTKFVRRQEAPDGTMLHCAIGALDSLGSSGRFSDENDPEVAALARLIPREFRNSSSMWPRMQSIADWNNAPERTGPEVAAMMRRAAEFC